LRGPSEFLICSDEYFFGIKLFRLLEYWAARLSEPVHDGYGSYIILNYAVARVEIGFILEDRFQNNVELSATKRNLE
jgi:hypothetical protein